MIVSGAAHGVGVLGSQFAPSATPVPMSKAFGENQITVVEASCTPSVMLMVPPTLSSRAAGAGIDAVADRECHRQL